METIINYFDHIFLVLPPTAEVQKAKEENHLVDATVGRRTKAVIFTGEGLVILSALQPETISRRFNAHGASLSEEQGDAEDE